MTKKHLGAFWAMLELASLCPFSDFGQLFGWKGPKYGWYDYRGQLRSIWAMSYLGVDIWQLGVRPRGIYLCLNAGWQSALVWIWTNSICICTLYCVVYYICKHHWLKNTWDFYRWLLSAEMPKFSFKFYEKCLISQIWKWPQQFRWWRIVLLQCTPLET